MKAEVQHPNHERLDIAAGRGAHEQTAGQQCQRQRLFAMLTE